MITLQEKRRAQRKALAFFSKAGIALTRAEKARIEVADFGLSELPISGLEILTYVNTSRCCAKELVLFPGQTCPEHRHPGHAGQLGKEETFRCRFGRVHLFVSGKPTTRPGTKPPRAPKGAYTVAREIILRTGEQHTIAPGTKHWFKAGPQGAVVSEFSTRSRDASDVFSDRRVQRMTRVLG